MTIQAGDIFSYNGEKTTIATEPLKPYLETRSDVGFIFKSTALVRGYIATWEIRNKKLYLASLVGFIENNKQVDLNYLFQNKRKFLLIGFLEILEFQRESCLKKLI
jgi:hypothetical protein